MPESDENFSEWIVNEGASEGQSLLGRVQGFEQLLLRLKILTPGDTTNMFKEYVIESFPRPGEQAKRGYHHLGGAVRRVTERPCDRSVP